MIKYICHISKADGSVNALDEYILAKSLTDAVDHMKKKHPDKDTISCADASAPLKDYHQRPKKPSI